MRKIVPGIVVLAGLAFAGAAFIQPAWVIALANADTCETSHAGLEGDERAIVDAINEERAAAGLDPYLVSPQVSKAAAWMAEDIATSGTFSHVDSAGRWPNERGTECIGEPLGENLAIGFFGGPEGVVEAWMGSSGHRANILGTTYRTVGIGIYGNVYVADFGWSTPGPVTAPPADDPPADDPPADDPPSPTATPSPSPTWTPAPTPEPPAAPSPAWTRSLEAGVNLVTYVGDTVPVAGALGPAAGQMAAVYHWDAASGQWQRYFPGKPAYINSLQWMESGEAYFILVTGAPIAS